MYEELRLALLNASDTATRSELLLKLDALLSEQNTLVEAITGERDTALADVTRLSEDNASLVTANGRMFIALGKTPAELVDDFNGAESIEADGEIIDEDSELEDVLSDILEEEE